MRMLRLSIPVLAAGMLLIGGISQAEPTQETETTARKTTKTVKHGKKTAADQSSRNNDPVAADNTGTNKRDRDENELTADQQKNSKSDVDLTAEIRRSIVQDKTLSTNAHNIKIIVQGGAVTLKGPVSSQQEKTAVEKKAVGIAGQGKVTNEVAIAP